MPSIRLFTKMLQIREFVNSSFCGCCIIQDFVPINRNVSTGNEDTSNVSYILVSKGTELPLLTFLSI